MTKLLSGQNEGIDLSNAILPPASEVDVSIYHEVGKLIFQDCEHVWTEYDSGFTQRYNYCIKCDKKEGT